MMHPVAGRARVTADLESSALAKSSPMKLAFYGTRPAVRVATGWACQCWVIGPDQIGQPTSSGYIFNLLDNTNSS